MKAFVWGIACALVIPTPINTIVFFAGLYLMYQVQKEKYE